MFGLFVGLVDVQSPMFNPPLAMGHEDFADMWSMSGALATYRIDSRTCGEASSSMRGSIISDLRLTIRTHEKSTGIQTDRNCLFTMDKDMRPELGFHIATCAAMS